MNPAVSSADPRTGRDAEKRAGPEKCHYVSIKQLTPEFGQGRGRNQKLRRLTLGWHKVHFAICPNLSLSVVLLKRNVEDETKKSLEGRGQGNTDKCSIANFSASTNGLKSGCHAGCYGVPTQPPQRKGYVAVTPGFSLPCMAIYAPVAEETLALRNAL